LIIDTDFSKHAAHNSVRYYDDFAASGGCLILKIKFLLEIADDILKGKRIYEQT